MNTTYTYNSQSEITTKENGKEIFLSHFNESYAIEEKPCFFWGKLQQPYVIARSLLMLSKIVSSNFMPTSSAMRDPVITSGGNKLRFEAFSGCCSIYGKVDVLPKAMDGEFLEQGTTNVDFNPDMISALSQIGRDEKVFFSVGKKDFVLQKSNKKVVEKKVSLPTRWIKGMANVQQISAEMNKVFTFNKLQTQLFFRAIPKGTLKNDYYLKQLGTKPMLSPVKSKGAICIGGLHRLRVVEGILPLTKELHVFDNYEKGVAFQFILEDVRFTVTLSRSHWRGFSGEGSTLENLLEDIPEAWIQKLDEFAQIKEEFSEKNEVFQELEQANFKHVCARLASIGLLGFDLHDQQYYYRKLPFKLERIESLNPRYKNALKILAKNKYEITDITDQGIKVLVEGSGLKHRIVLDDKTAKCTCTWYAEHQGKRGDCKHILVAKTLKNNSEKQIADLLKEFEL
ncbi:MAG: SWIM zinc finger family protein [Flavobacteriales bacterium]